MEKEKLDPTEHAEENSRLARIIDLVKCHGKGRKLLDVGLGKGIIAKELKNDFEVIGMELDEECITIARRKGVKVVMGDITEDWPFRANEFDVVIMAEVIEHITNEKFVMGECTRVLKKDGLLVLSTPNVASLVNRLRLLRGRRPFYAGTAGSAHLRVYEIHDLIKEIFLKPGFKIKRITSSGMTIRLFGHKGYLVNRKICDIFPQFGDRLIVAATNTKEKVR